MDVDVLTRHRNRAASFRGGRLRLGSDNATVWYENIKKVEWKSPRALVKGQEWPSRPDSWAER